MRQPLITYEKVSTANNLGHFKEIFNLPVGDALHVRIGIFEIFILLLIPQEESLL